MAVYASIATVSTLDITWIGLIASSTAALLNLVAIMCLNKVISQVFEKNNHQLNVFISVYLNKASKNKRLLKITNWEKTIHK